MIRHPSAFALFGSLLLAASAATAQTASLVPPGPVQLDPNRRPLPVPGGSEDVRPLEQVFGHPRGHYWLHDFVLQSEIGASRMESKQPTLPSKTDAVDVSLGVSFSILDRGFGNVTLSHAEQDTQSKNTVGNGAISIDADTDSTGIQLGGGWFLLPFMAAGVNLNYGSSSGQYQFAINVPANATGAGNSSVSPFVTFVAPLGNWFFSLTGAWTYADYHQDYTNNTPPRQDSWSKTTTLAFDANYQLNRDWRLGGLVAWNHKLDERAMGSESAIDPDWLAVSLRAGYQLTRDVELTLTGTTWLMNDKYDFDRIALGLRYRF